MRIVFTSHAAQRIFERALDSEDVMWVALYGEIIKTYPNDKPYPSVLLLGYVDDMPLHVVRSDDLMTQASYIITVYSPYFSVWQPDFKKKK